MATKNKIDSVGKQRRAHNAGSLYQKSAGGTWYMRFTERDADGKRRRVVISTGTSDKAAAQRVLEDKIAEYGFGSDAERHVEKLLVAQRNAENERMRVERERAEIEAKRQAETEAAAKMEREKAAVDLAGAFGIFLVSKRRPDSGEGTLRHYEGEYNRFVNWMKQTYPNARKMKDVTPEMAVEFIDHIEDRQSRNTRNKYLIFLRMFWRVMRWEPNAMLGVDPWDGIRTLTRAADEVIHRELTIEELEAVAEVIRADKPLPIIREKGNAKSKPGSIRDAFTANGESIRHELRRLFVIGIYSGQRLGDCATLQWSAVDMVRGIITLVPSKTRSKTGRQVIVPVHPVLAAVLAETPKVARKGYVLPNVAALYLNCNTMLTKRIQVIFQAAGIETSTEAPRSGSVARTIVGFHSLRHTFSSIMLNAGVSPAHVDAMLCHSKSSMTMRYYHEHAEALAVAVARLPYLKRFALDEKTVTDAAAANATAVTTHVDVNQLKAALLAMTPEQRAELLSMAR